MRFTPSELRLLADTVADLNKTGVEVEKIRANGHDIFLKMEDNDVLVIVGISNSKTLTRQDGATVR